jgi:diguanylate cyclase (GGDEF)-like protein/PAS domain S-box-containing protein
VVIRVRLSYIIDNEDLSPVLIMLLRVVCAVAAVLYIGFGYVYRLLDEQSVDPIPFGHRILFAIAYLTVFVLSYYVRPIKNRYLAHLVLCLVVASFAHTAFLGAQLGFISGSQVTLLMIIPLANAILQSRKIVLLLNLAFIGIVVAMLTSGACEYPLLYFLATLMITGSSYLMARVRHGYAKRYEDLFNQAPIGIASHRIIWEKDRKPQDYRILEVNRTFEHLLEREAKDVVGKTVREVIPTIGPDWLKEYANLATNANEVHFEKYLEGTGKYFEVKAYKLDGNQFVAVFNDTTRRRQTEEALRKSQEQLKSQKQLLQTILDNAPINIWLTDPEGEPLLINRRFQDSTGWGTTTPSITEEELLVCRRTDQEALVSDYPQEYEEEITFQDNTRHIVRTIKTRIVDENGQIVGVLGIGLDITEQKKAEEELKRITFHDSLTGLYNRRYFEMEVKRLDRERQLPISLVMADVNGLKIVNDSLGHQQGDLLLIKCAQVLRAACRREDMITRWGGDEFVILLPNTSEKDAAKVCARIRQLSDQVDEDPIKLSISLGYATKTVPEQSIADILREAENHMYRKKSKHAQENGNELVGSLQRALQAKSHETKEHTDNIEFLAVSLGKRIGLNERELDDLRTLAQHHDIGQIATDSSILKKRGPLSSQEREVMRRHAEIGYRIALAFSKLAPVAESILSHHEWWNGEGYPRGLKGLEIPLPARILAIVDAFDSMVGTRPYHHGRSVPEALDELNAYAGTQFQPDLVEVFTEMMKEPAMEAGLLDLANVVVE